MKVREDTLKILVNNLSLRDYAYVTKDISNLEIEIERLNRLLSVEKEYREKFDKDNQRLYNIIKEVREFAKLRKEMYERQENVVGQEVIISLLNILDKGE